MPLFFEFKFCLPGVSLILSLCSVLREIFGLLTAKFSNFPISYMLKLSTRCLILGIECTVGFKSLITDLWKQLEDISKIYFNREFFLPAITNCFAHIIFIVGTAIYIYIYIYRNYLIFGTCVQCHYFLEMSTRHYCILVWPSVISGSLCCLKELPIQQTGKLWAAPHQPPFGLCSLTPSPSA